MQDILQSAICLLSIIFRPIATRATRSGQAPVSSAVAGRMAGPSTPRKRPNKGGKKTKQRTLSGRPGIAKKSVQGRRASPRGSLVRKYL
jgi:hypothetical protein